MGHNKHVDLFKDMIPAVDLGIKELWDASSDDGKKEIIGDLYNLNRYISNVKSNDRELQEHFVLTVNEFYNKKIKYVISAQNIVLKRKVKKVTFSYDFV